MARLFAKGTNSDLQEEVFQAVTPALLYSLRSQNAYDEWLQNNILSNRWRPFVMQNQKLKFVRWGYFAKLLNIVVYDRW
jgi:hypothetical protein